MIEETVVVAAVEEEQPLKPKKKRRVLVDVRIIEREGESVLVEWAKPPKGVSRGFIELADIKGRKVDAEVLEAAHSYGVPWAKLIDLEDVTPERVEAELYRHGIWTVADIESKMPQARRALLMVAALTIGELHNRGSEFERFKKEEG